MKDTEKSRPGRPPKYDRPLKRVQLLVFENDHDAAQAEADKRGASISEIYREWIEKGRKRR